MSHKKNYLSKHGGQLFLASIYMGWALGNTKYSNLAPALLRNLASSKSRFSCNRPERTGERIIFSTHRAKNKFPVSPHPKMPMVVTE